MKHSYDEFIADIKRFKLKIILKPFELSESYKHSNGCGSKGGVNVPDSMWGVDVQSACHIHDMEWMKANSYEELLFANERFDNNLKRICDAQSNFITKRLRRYRIATYVNEVELLGTIPYARERGFL